MRLRYGNVRSGSERGHWRSGAGARRASLLAFAFISGLSGGCRPARVSGTERHTVNLDALLTLHPAWAQVKLLDEEGRRFVAVPARVADVTPITTPFPTGFAPPQAIPPNLARERQARVREDAARYVNQLDESLDNRNRAALTREARREKKRVEVELTAAKAKIRDEVRGEVAHQTREFSRQILRLQDRDAALDTQIQAYIGSPLQDAISQKRLVQQQIAALTGQSQQAVASIEPTVTARAALVASALAAASQARLKQKSDEMEAAVQARLKNERDRLAAQPDDIAPPGTAIPPVDPRKIPVLRLSGHLAADTMQGSLAAFSAKMQTQQATWRQRRERLIASIRRDTEQAVLQLARRDGWKLVEDKSKSDGDLTAQAATFLREQWQRTTP